jgi:hypothetical protein
VRIKSGALVLCLRNNLTQASFCCFYKACKCEKWVIFCLDPRALLEAFQLETIEETVRPPLQVNFSMLLERKINFCRSHKQTKPLGRIFTSHFTCVNVFILVKCAFLHSNTFTIGLSYIGLP